MDKEKYILTMDIGGTTNMLKIHEVEEASLLQKNYTWV